MPQAWPKKKSYNGETNNKQQSNKQHKRKVSKDLNRHVSKDKIQMAMKHMKMFYAIRHSGDVNQIHAHETHAILFLFFFFWLHRRHAEVPGPGMETAPQQ